MIPRLTRAILQFLRRRGFVSRTWRERGGVRIYGWRIGPSFGFRKPRKHSPDRNQLDLFT